MTSLRKGLARAGLVATLVALFVLARPAPEQARANPLCDAASAPAHAITGGLGAITGGAIGGGNPVGDACNAVTGKAIGAITSPVSGALKGVGNDVLKQVATWVSEGAAWLMGRVAQAIDSSTTPHLDTRGFLQQYGKMAEIAVVMAAAMLLLAVLEGLAQGSLASLARTAFFDLPLALIGTSVAFVVVQLLLGATDGLCEAVSGSTSADSQRFFAEAIHSLAVAGAVAGGALSGTAGGGPANGAVAVPLFVTFLVAVIAAFASFFVWIELLMRDAAIYVVALFVPLSLAASIWPRWSGALRRTAELLVVVIASKFVIVAILSLAASLLAHNAGQVEQILAASALMLLACFSPIVLLRLVPFAEGAMAAAYARRSATGGALAGVHLATQVQMMRQMAHANWRGSGATETLSGGGATGGSPGPKPGGGPRGGGGSPGGGGPASTGGAGSAGGGAAAGSTAAAGPAAAVAVPVAAAKGSKAAAGRLGRTASAESTGRAGASRETSSGSTPSGPAARPQGGSQPASTGKDTGKGAATEQRPAQGDLAPDAKAHSPRPAPESSTPRPSGAKPGE